MALNGSLWLEYDHMDVVVTELVQLRNKDFQYAYIIVGRSMTTSSLTILTQPTTTFMNTISSNAMTILYPDLINERRGIINSRKPVRKVPRLLKLFKERYDFKSSLSKWQEHADHRCSQDPRCPFKLRDMLDGCAATLPLIADPLHFTNPRIPVIPQLIWRLRCVLSCEPTKPLPGQEEGEVGSYLWRGGWIGKLSVWNQMVHPTEDQITDDKDNADEEE